MAAKKKRQQYPTFSAGAFLVDVNMPNGFLEIGDFLNTEVEVVQSTPAPSRSPRLGRMRVRDVVEKFG